MRKKPSTKPLNAKQAGAVKASQPKLPAKIHPSAIVEAGAQIGAGATDLDAAHGGTLAAHRRRNVVETRGPTFPTQLQVLLEATGLAQSKRIGGGDKTQAVRVGQAYRSADLARAVHGGQADLELRRGRWLRGAAARWRCQARDEDADRETASECRLWQAHAR